MSETRQDGRGPSFPVGCGFLSATDVQAAIEGRLAPERRTEFERHIVAGCADCVTLAADLETYSRVVSRGVLPAERREAEREAEPLRQRLRSKIRKRDTVPS